MSPAQAARAFAPMRLLGYVPAGEIAASLSGAVLLADLANFSGLTEALEARAGTDGADAVGHDLNRALAPVVDAVMRHGGEVVKFSGDGLLCVFAGDAAGGARSAAEAIAAATVPGPGGTIHRFRVAVVRGGVTLARLGGHRGRVELVATGEAVRKAQRLAVEASPGSVREIVLPLGPLEPGAGAAETPGAEAEAWACLPAWVRQRLAGGRSEWLQELRALTVMFVACAAEGTDTATLQRRAVALQAAVDAAGGELMRLSVEGDGLVAEVAFGLTLGAAAAGPREAVRCASALADTLDGARIGLATGRVLLGPIGPDSRRQLTSNGRTVNLAARLMQRAAAGQVLADELTWAAVAGEWTGTRDEAPLKGMGTRVFWRLAAQAPAETPGRAFVGRSAEMEAVRALLAVSGPEAPALVLRAEAGMGKSRFCGWVQAELGACGVACWQAVATPVGRDTPYGAFADVLRDLCGLRVDAEPPVRLREVAGRLLGDPDRAPLLADALGLSVPDTAATRALGGQVRAENIREALVAVFRARAKGGPAALIVEDAHWLDSASWTLLQRLAGQAGELRIVIAVRPMPGREPAALQALLARGARLLELQPLSAADIAAVAARRIGVDALPPALAGWIAERAAGNPFFAQELVAMLAALGEVEVRDGRIVRAPDRGRLAHLPGVPSIEGTLEQRIDRLGVDDAIVLQVASVIGPVFELGLLARLTALGTSHVQEVAQRLVAAEMTVPAGGGRHAFRHRYTQDAAYRMLPGERRRELHRRVALWVEQGLGEHADARAGELAHHWFAAEERSEAIRWLERAGMQALRTGADREAVTHFRRALSIGEGQPAGRLASWRRRLARGLFGLGEVEGVAQEARTAVELVACPLPGSAAGWSWLCVRLSLSRLAGRSGLPPLRAQAEEDVLEGARAAGLLAESAYFLNAPEMMMGSALLAVSLAERTPNAAPVSVAYGMLGVVAGMARLHGVAQRYLARARAVSQAADDAYQLGVAWFYTGMYHGCTGDWAASYRAAQQALALTEPLGAHTQSGYQLTLVATNALYTSDYACTRARMATVLERAQAAANVQQEGWACNVVAVADLHQGRYADAIARTERSRQIFLVERDLVSLIIGEGIQCASWARSGRMDRALEGAARCLALVRGARPTTWGQLEGFAGPCEVYALALKQGLLRHAQVRADLHAALAALRMFALVFPFGRARERWARAQLAGALGRHRAERLHLRAALRHARRYGMPYEEWLALQALQPLADGAEAAALAARAGELRLAIEGRPDASAAEGATQAQAA